MDDKQLVGAGVRDVDGRHIGSVTALLVDPSTLSARWVNVQLGDGQVTVFPVDAASVGEDGVLSVPFSESLLRSAPGVADGDLISADEAGAVRRHLGFEN